MNKIIKISYSTSLKLKKLMKSLDEAGCNPEEKIKAQKIFKIYFDGKVEINKWRNYYYSYYLLPGIPINSNIVLFWYELKWGLDE